MPEHRGCAFHSRQRGEPQLGTASTVRRWFLVEQPGPWGHDAVRESRLPLDTAEALAGRARALGARLVLIRRPGGAAEPVDRTAYLVSTVPGDRRAARLRFRDPAELVDVDVAAFRAGAGRVGDPEPGPLVLVCTNGRHDSCCAVEGRPVAAAFGGALGDGAWECSHIGGDRFAANVVWLPEGVYYGRVTVADVPDLASRMREGRLALDHLRGRVPYPMPVQTAEGALRRELELDHVDAVTVVEHRRPREDRVEVRFDVGGAPWDVVVEVTRERLAHLLTCRASHPHHPPVHRVLDLHPA